MDVTEVLEVRTLGLKTPTTGWAFKTNHGVFVIAVEGHRQRGPSKVYPSLDAIRADLGEQAHFEPWEPQKLPEEVRVLILECALLASRTAQAVVVRYIAGTMAAESAAGASAAVQRAKMTAGRYCDE